MVRKIKKQKIALEPKKRRKSAHDDAVADGIKAAIEAKGQKPTPAAFLGCIISVLSVGGKDLVADQSARVVQLLGLLNWTVREVSYGLLMANRHLLMKHLASVITRHHMSMDVLKKTFACVRAIFHRVVPTGECLSMLDAMIVNRRDVEGMKAYLQTLTFVYTSGAALCQSQKSESATSSNVLPRQLIFRRLPQLIETLLPNMIAGSSHDAVTTATAAAIKSVLAKVIIPPPPNEPAPPTDAGEETVLMAIMLPLKTALDSAQFIDSWDLTADILAVVIRQCGRHRCRAELNQIVMRLDELLCTGDFHFAHSSERALGTAMRVYGCRDFLSLIPLEIVIPDDRGPDAASRRFEYLLGLLRRYVSHDQLGYFLEALVPQALLCSKKSAHLLTAGQIRQAKYWQNIEQQIWSSLSGFCNYPSDANNDAVVRNLAKAMMGRAAEDNASSGGANSGDGSIRAVIMRSLRMLVEINMRLSSTKNSLPVDEEEDDEDVAHDPHAKAIRSEQREVKKQSVFARTTRQLTQVDDEAAAEAEDPHRYHGISVEQAEQAVALLAKYSTQIIPRLCNLYEGAPVEGRAQIWLALRSLAAIAPPAVINKTFTIALSELKSTQERLGNTSEEDMAETDVLTNKITGLVDIAGAVGAQLDEDNTKQLYGALKQPLLEDDVNPALQKHVYRVLARSVLSRQVDSGFTLLDTRDVIALLKEAGPKCNPAARRERLAGYRILFDGLFATGEHRALVDNLIQDVVVEPIFCSKDQNNRTRKVAFDIVERLAELHFTRDGSITPYLHVVMAGLGGQTPAMVSATIVVLARLMFVHFESLPLADVTVVLRQISAQISHHSTEIATASMSFIKLMLKLVNVYEDAKSVLLGCLPSIAAGCLLWAGLRRSPGTTRMAVRVLLERCIKKFGFDEVRALFPEQHRRLVDYVEKERKKLARRKKNFKKGEDTAAEKVAKMKDKSNRVAKFTSVMLQGDEAILAKRKEMKQAAASRQQLMLKDRSGDTDEVMDLLDPSAVRHLSAPKSKRDIPMGDADGDDEYQVEFDASGSKVVISDFKSASSNRDIGKASSGLLRPSKRKRHLAGYDDADDDGAGEAGEEEGVAPATADGSSGRKILRPVKQRRSNSRSGSAPSVSGERFKPKDGIGGDMKKAAGVEPFAYLPLSGKYINKPKKNSLIPQLKSMSDSAREDAKHARKKQLSLRKDPTKHASKSKQRSKIKRRAPPV